MDLLERRCCPRGGLSFRDIRRRKFEGDLDLDLDLLVEIVDTESAEEAERERDLLEFVGAALGLDDRRSNPLRLASASARTLSTTPLL